jgi:hypothetical protein
MTRFPVGHAGRTIDIAEGWRVLDVGSGHNPHPRADVLLERFVGDDRERAGSPTDAHDPRLVVGDACAMPFADLAFDFVIASHIAEHVDDPIALGSELARVARAGYIETPGGLGDLILREDYHPWRVTRTRRGLRFSRVRTPRPLGHLGETFYAVLYYDEDRPGHRHVRFSPRIIDASARLAKRALGRVWRLPGIRSLTYTSFWFNGPFEVLVDSKPLDGGG